MPAGPRLDVPDPDGGVEGAGDDVDAVELQRVDAVRVAWKKMRIGIKARWSQIPNRIRMVEPKYKLEK